MPCIDPFNIVHFNLIENNTQVGHQITIKNNKNLISKEKKTDLTNLNVMSNNFKYR
jgi:hypothetical protein